MMKLLKMTLIASLFMSITSFLGNSMVAASSMDSAEVEQFVDQMMKERMEELRIPNAAVSVVANGETIVSKGYGLADMDESRQVDAETTLFRLGSISKLFTWTAVMQLAEQGKVDLSADVNTYLDFEIPSRTKTAGESEPITLTHLLTHTPGFEDYSETLYRLSEADTRSLHEYVQGEMPARIFPPGYVSAYSNYGTALAGYIVEQVSGMPFADYVEQHIFAPLGMEYSTFRQPIPEDLAGHMAQAYRYVDGEYREGAFEFLPGPAGSMSSTAGDLARFMLAHLQGGSLDGETILAEDTVRLMHSQLFAHSPHLDGMAHGFIERTVNGQRVLFHPGSTMLFDAGLYLVPSENVGLFIAYSGGNYFAHTEIFQAFMDRYFPASPVMEGASENVPAEGTMERSRSLVGEYHQNRRNWTTSEKFISLTMGMIHVDLDEEGHLLVSHMGETSRFVEVEPNVYHNLDRGEAKDPFGDFGTIVFGKDPAGSMMLMADGPMTYSKVPWYSTSGFTFSMLILTLVFVIGSLVYSGIASGIRLVRRRRKQHQPILAVTARGAAAVYGLLAVGFVSGIIVTSEFDPVYGLPKAYFGVVPAWAPVIDFLPVLMVLVGAALVLFTVLAWKKGYWRRGGRIHYTLYTAATVVLLWIFSYWNLLMIF
ncbi:class A beta-lactamase-related serine hydrolase [Xylanibacillus composti]|nr:class A beta-lactamase-related serine hydrolase [Xylanibacillus composti]